MLESRDVWRDSDASYGQGRNVVKDRTVLRLFVTGAGARSVEVIEAVQAFVAEQLGGDAQLEVVDVLLDPGAAEREHVLATPMLVRVSPRPERRVVGDLSQARYLRESLDM